MAIIQRQTKKGVRWDVKLRDAQGRQYSRTFRTKKEAAAYEANEVNSHNRGTWVDPRNSEMCFRDLAQRWLDMGVGKRTKTRVRDEGIVQRHLLPTLGHRAIGSIRNSDLQELVNTWNTAGLSPGTLQRHKAVLSAIFNLAVNDDLLARSPVRGLRMPRLEASEGRVLTPSEAQRLLDAVAPAYWAVLYILMTTGMRWSELAGLNIGHLDLISRTPTLNIRQGAHEVSTGVEIAPTKSHAGNRTLHLSQEQVTVISKYLANTGRSGENPDEPLFVSPTGKRVAYRNFHARVWTPAIETSGLVDLRIHDLRKTAATRLLQAGIDHKTITAMLGHEDLRTTLQHYAKATPESLQAASQRLVDAVQSGDVITYFAARSVDG